MKNLNNWLSTPIQPGTVIWYWFAITILVFTAWFVIPIACGAHVRWEYLSLPLSLQNIAFIISTSFGEEFVFRVLPIVLFLYVFPEKKTCALLASIFVAYPFGLWHEWILTDGASFKTGLGLGGVILSVAYLKFGGAQGKKFEGFVASGSIHATCNALVAFIANVVTAS